MDTTLGSVRLVSALGVFRQPHFPFAFRPSGEGSAIRHRRSPHRMRGRRTSGWHKRQSARLRNRPAATGVPLVPTRPPRYSVSGGRSQAPGSGRLSSVPGLRLLRLRTARLRHLLRCHLLRALRADNWVEPLLAGADRDILRHCRFRSRQFSGNARSYRDSFLAKPEHFNCSLLSSAVSAQPDCHSAPDVPSRAVLSCFFLAPWPSAVSTLPSSTR